MKARFAGLHPLTAALIALGFTGFSYLAPAQIIPNPSFESNSFSVGVGYISGNGAIVGWTTTDAGAAGLNPANGSPFADNGVIPNGNNVAFIQRSATSSLGTTISNLTVGLTYKVNFRVNARAAGGGLPNLKIAIGGANLINASVTPVGPTNAYQYFAFDFTAAATNQMMTLSNDASIDSTVLIDNFSIAVRNSGWSYAAWSNDASSGVSSNRNYTHAYNFGSSSNATINGVTFTNTGNSNGNPSVAGSFSTTGLPNFFNNDTNSVTGNGGSHLLANDFLWGGAVESITLQGLTIGKSYVATIYSFGFDTSAARAATFSLGNDRLTVNQDQFGNGNGIRVSCCFTASATSNTLTYVPLNTNNTFHTCGFSVYQVPELVVTTTADSGPGSLRQLVSQADVFTVITFTNTLSGQTIVLTNGQLTPSNNLTIDASSLSAGITLSGNNSNRIFEVGAGATLTLNSLSLSNGFVGSSNGGAILVDTGGTLTLNNSTLSGNSAVGGGGIFNSGALALNNSTLSGNTAADGGGVYNPGALTLNNSTLSGNSASLSGGGINNPGILLLTNAIVAGNSAGLAGSNILGAFSITHNLIDVNPLLAPLGNYGGPTQTMPPLNASPAIDSGSDSVTNFLATDQRGFPRKIGAHVDIGAAEYMASQVVTTTADAGGGSLRDAVAFSTNGAAITFTNTLSGQTIVLTNGQLTSSNNLTIDASSLSAGITLSGNHSANIFEIGTGTTVTLNSLTLINGGVSFTNGGAIMVDSNGTLTLDNSTLSGNSALSGGGIWSAGTLTLNNSTLAGNSASSPVIGSGGGIYMNSGTVTLHKSTLSGNSASSSDSASGGGIYMNTGTLTLDNSTLSGNSATGGSRGIGSGGGAYIHAGTLRLNNSTLSGNSATGKLILGSHGGGIYNNLGTLLLTNTIVAGNSAGSNADIFGSSSSFNSLIGGSPQLAPLGNYGGRTQTMPPLAGSPAIDAGTDSVTNLLAADQRGYPRKSGAHVDIGAVEAQWAATNNPPLLSSPVVDSNGAFGFSFAYLQVADFTVLASTNVALPLAQWSPLGPTVLSGPGQYLFFDPGWTNYPQRFYILISP